MDRIAEQVAVCVDAFNLYCGALKGTPYRWLDLRKLCTLLLPRLGKPVGLLNPFAQHPSKVLVREATFVKHIRPRVLAASQFLDTLSDVHGTFRKPASW